MVHHTAPETTLTQSNCGQLFSREQVTATTTPPPTTLFNYLFHFLALDIGKLRCLQTKPWFECRPLVALLMPGNPCGKTPVEEVYK